MNVVLVGGGGREAALAWRIARSPSLTSLTCVAPSPGWPAGVRVVPGDPVEVARGADLVVVGPEAPLGQGLADRLGAAGIPCFGPVAAAARLETSKAFAKDVMRACGVPTAGAVVVELPEGIGAARERCAQGRVVLKADGLAAGKGVIVCETASEALAALEQFAAGRFGEAGRRLLLEDLLTGPEVSLFALCDGERVVALPSAQDHKRLGDGDTGPNTGGMGAYAPCRLVGPALADELVERVHLPVVRELQRRGIAYRGVLFAGLMMTADGPRVLEFNVRFGDPECQALMALWDDDVLLWLHGAATGQLPERKPRFRDGAACCVVVASPGYPDAPTVGIPIAEGAAIEGVEVFYAGAARQDGRLVTSGGRVLGITGVGADLDEARRRAFAGVEAWRFPGAVFRRDIGARG